MATADPQVFRGAALRRYEQVQEASTPLVRIHPRVFAMLWLLVFGLCAFGAALAHHLQRQLPHG